MSLYRRLFLNLKPYLGRLYLAIFFSVIVGVIATSPVPIIQQTFDKIFVEKDYFMLKVIPLALILLYVVKAVLTYAQNLIIFGISCMSGLRIFTCNGNATSASMHLGSFFRLA